MENKESYISASDWARIIAKTWKDPEFKEAMERNPKEAIKASFPGLITEETRVFNFPPKPENMSDENLDKMIEKRGHTIFGLCI